MFNNNSTACALALLVSASAAFGQCPPHVPLDPVPTPSWVDFVEDASVFAIPIADIDEKDLVAADFDGDDDLDILIVSKENFYNTGVRAHRVLINNGGVLSDESAQISGPNYASRDVAVLDADNDGFMDFVVANTTSDIGGVDQPAPVGLYINDSTVPGTFNGFTAATGWLTPCTMACVPTTCEVALRACAIASGDVNDDGFDDIWVTTYGPGSISATSLSGDRLYLNDPLNPGSFDDVTTEALGCLATVVGGGLTSAAIGDFDDDDRVDLFRGGPFAGNQILFNAGNLPTGVPTFVSPPGSGVPGTGYMAAIADLNDDEAPDVYVSGDLCDIVSINPGGSAARQSGNWTVTVLEDQDVHNKLRGNTIAGGGNVFFGDLDGDGMTDVGVGDIDTSVQPSRTDLVSVVALLRNRTAIGMTNFGGLEDADALEELAINLTDNSVWDGVIIDLDGDGVHGVFLATETGFRFFRQLPYGSNYGQLSPNSAGPGAVMGFAGRPSISENDFTLLASGVPPGVSGQFFYGLDETNQPLFDGFLLASAPHMRLAPVTSDAGGLVAQTIDFTAPEFAQAMAGTELYFQLLYRDPGFGLFGLNLSDGLELTLWE